MRLRSFATPLLATAVVALSGCNAAPPPSPPPPPSVEVAEALVRDVPVTMESIGETVGASTVEVRARVEGFIQEVHFREGSRVTQGQLLYTIDPRPFEVSLAQARASLAEAEAQLVKARQDVARLRPLAEQNAVPRSDLDNSVVAEAAARAAVDAATAVVERAELDLSYTTITAGTAGLIGRNEFSVGNLVGRGQPTLLTTISRTDPIHVRFSMSERAYLELARRVESDPSATRASLELLLSDGSVHPHRGTFVFADRVVDAATGTLLLEASFPNPEGIVRPGQFARVRAIAEVLADAVLVPQRAVLQTQSVTSLAVVGADDVVELRQVEMGQRMGTLWVVRSGLKGGERIVVEGLQKVRHGAPVTPTLVTVDDAALAVEG